MNQVKHVVRGTTKLDGVLSGVDPCTGFSKILNSYVSRNDLAIRDECSVCRSPLNR